LPLLNELNYFKQQTHQGISFWNHVLCASAKFEISDAEEPSYRIGWNGHKLKIIAEVGIQKISQTKVTAIKKLITT
jgi:hypothetical protein